MSAPTTDQLALAVAAWWSAGRPYKLDELRAQLAALVTDPLTSVRANVTSSPSLAIVIHIETGDELGNVTDTTAQSVTQDDLGSTVADDFADIIDDSQTSMRQRGQVP